MNADEGARLMKRLHIPMKREEAIQIARKTAEERGWPWDEPIQTTLHRPWWIERLFGKKATWIIFTNSEARGRNVTIRLDDESGEVLGRWFAPR